MPREQHKGRGRSPRADGPKVQVVGPPRPSLKGAPKSPRSVASTDSGSRSSSRSLVGQPKDHRQPQKSAKKDRDVGQRLRQALARQQKRHSHDPSKKSMQLYHSAVSPHVTMIQSHLATSKLPWAIVRAIGQMMDPLNYAPSRLASIQCLSGVGTAQCVETYTESLSWPSTPLNTNFLPAGPRGRVLTTDPLKRAMVLLRDPVVMGVTQRSFPENVPLSIYRIVTPVLWNWLPQMTFNCPFTCLTHDGGTQKYANWQPVALINGKNAFWVDAATQAQASIDIHGVVLDAAGSVGAEVKMVLNRHISEFEDELSDVSGSFTVPAVGSTFDIGPVNITTSGYYSLQLRMTAANAGIPPTKMISFRMTGIFLRVATVLTHVHLTHRDVIESTGWTMKDIKVLGAGILVSNTTAEMFKSGTIYARQLMTDTVWYDGLGDVDAYTETNTRMNNGGTPMEKGLYAIGIPCSVDSLELKPAVNSIDYEAGLSAPSSYTTWTYRPFCTGGGVQVLFAPVADQASVTTMNADLLTHIMRGLEFTGSSQMVLVAEPVLARMVTEMVLDELQRAPLFFENPLHFSDIRRFLSNAGSWAWRNRAMIAGVASHLLARTAA